jgi:hypothetical protein
MSEAEPIDYESDVSPQRQRQQQLGDLVDRCVEDGVDALIDALMSLGKTHAAANVASRTGRKVTVFTRLWNTREQIMKERSRIRVSLRTRLRSSRRCKSVPVTRN